MDACRREQFQEHSIRDSTHILTHSLSLLLSISLCLSSLFFSILLFFGNSLAIHCSICFPLALSLFVLAVAKPSRVNMLSTFLALFLASLLGAVGAGAITFPATVEVDLVFPRNDTYTPAALIPIVFAIQNAQLAASLDPNNYSIHYRECQ